MMVLMVVLTLLVAMGSYGCRMMISGKESQSTSKLADAKGRCASIKREISSLKTRSHQRQWQKQLGDEGARWVTALDATLMCASADIWFTRVETSNKDSSLTLEGTAASFEALSAFMSSLRKTGVFSDVQLGSANIREASGVSYLEFSMPLKLKARIAGSPDANEPAQKTGDVPQLKESP